MRILQLASEAVPFAKTGGLADVVGALSAWLASRGHAVTLFLPLYRAVLDAGVSPGEPVSLLEAGTAGADNIVVRAVDAIEGVEVRLVDAPRLFDRVGLYGTERGDHPDNAERFATFVRAALASTARTAAVPDVIHCHDWQAALAPALLHAGARQADLGKLTGSPTLLTLHNLAYQGTFPREELVRAGIPEPLLASGAFDLPGGMSLLRAGLVTADRISTVSPTYAREIARPEMGFGLEDVIAALAPPVTGILNAIDTSIWNPRTDTHLPARFGQEDLAGKACCKRALQEAFGLEARPDLPVFGMVSRLVEQKGLGLVEALRDGWADLPAQFIFLGTGEERFERLLRELDVDAENVGSRIAFSERLAHLVEAGSDFFLMPSAFEPSGLNQMISQAYGTPPIVHRVGGLADTVVHASPEAIASGSATGIVFDDFNVDGFRWALGCALDVYAHPEWMHGLRQAAMRRDFSWDVSGRQYEDLYSEMVVEGTGTETVRR